MRLILVFISIFSFHYNSFSQCSPPSNIQSELIDSTSVKISWDIQEGIEYYRIRYKELGGNSWIMLSNPTNINGEISNRNIYNLSLNSTYELQIKSWCENTANSEWSTSIYFSTNIVFGCMNDYSLNFDPNANFDYGCINSCFYRDTTFSLVDLIVSPNYNSSYFDNLHKCEINEMGHIFYSTEIVDNWAIDGYIAIDENIFNYTAPDQDLGGSSLALFKFDENGEMINSVQIEINPFGSPFYMSPGDIIPTSDGGVIYQFAPSLDMTEEWLVSLNGMPILQNNIYGEASEISLTFKFDSLLNYEWSHQYSFDNFYLIYESFDEFVKISDDKIIKTISNPNNIYSIPSPYYHDNDISYSFLENYLLTPQSIEIILSLWNDTSEINWYDFLQSHSWDSIEFEKKHIVFDLDGNILLDFNTSDDFLISNNSHVFFTDGISIKKFDFSGNFIETYDFNTIIQPESFFEINGFIFSHNNDNLVKLGDDFQILEYVFTDIDTVRKSNSSLIIDKDQSSYILSDNFQVVDSLNTNYFDYYANGTFFQTYVSEPNNYTGINMQQNFFEVTKLSKGELFFNIENLTCSNFGDGEIAIETNNLTPPFQYDWSTGATTPNITNLDTGLYHLTVTDSLGCVSSDSVRVELRNPPANDMYPQICNVTVDDQTGKNKIKVTNLSDSLLLGYGIFKEVSTDVFTQITTIDYTQEEYIDETSTPLVNANRYKIAAIDVCTNESDLSPAHKTVHLTMNEGVNGEVNLIWNPYEGFTVSNYLIYRSIDGGQMSFIGFVAGNIYSYTDLTPPSGILNYEVRMIAEVCPPIVSNPLFSVALIADTIKSNIITHENIDYLGVNLVANNPSCATCNDGSIVALAYGGTAPYNHVWSNGVITSFNFNIGIGSYTLFLSDYNGNYLTETITLTAESSVVLGCTDSDAINYNADATDSDGSCEYPVVDNPCDITPSGLFVDNIIHQRVAFNWSAPSSAPSYYMIRYRPVGTNSWTVMSAGPQNDVPFTGTSRTRYFMEPGTTYQWNIRARVVDENGATVCQSPWSASHQYTTLPACANLTDLSVNPEANLVYFNASKPSGDWGVWQAKGKIREVGSNNYRYLATTVDNYTNQIKYNFTPSTDYEWHTKAWCTGNVDEDGNSDPQYHSGWGEFSAFTTQDPCDKLPTNLSTTSGNNANTAITMSWDTPTSGQPHHYFLELTNETTGQVFSWNNLAGSSTSKTKYGQSSGDQFKWRIRGACGENGTSWATSFTGYEYYTLGGDRLGNDSQSNSQLTSISVYPNPSRGEFNISFDLESRQDVYLSITNYLGEVIFTEELKDQEGQYNETIDLGNKANGIYMLNITTNNQNINQRIVIQ